MVPAPTSWTRGDPDPNCPIGTPPLQRGNSRGCTPRSGTGIANRAHHTRSRHPPPARDRAAAPRRATRCPDGRHPPGAPPRLPPVPCVLPRSGQDDERRPRGGRSPRYPVAKAAPDRLVCGSRRERVRRHEQDPVTRLRREPQDQEPGVDERTCPQPRPALPSVRKSEAKPGFELEPHDRTPRASHRVKTKGTHEHARGQNRERARDGGRRRASPDRQCRPPVDGHEPGGENRGPSKVETARGLGHGPAPVRLGELVTRR